MCFNSSFVPHKSDVAYSDIFLKLPINVKLKYGKLVLFSERSFYCLVDWSAFLVKQKNKSALKFSFHVEVECCS